MGQFHKSLMAKLKMSKCRLLQYLFEAFSISSFINQFWSFTCLNCHSSCLLIGIYHGKNAAFKSNQKAFKSTKIGVYAPILEYLGLNCS